MIGINNKLALFLHNYNTIKKAEVLRTVDRSRRGENGRLAAFYYALHNQPINCEAIKACIDMISANPNITSRVATFRIASFISLKSNPADELARIDTVYKLMSDAGFLSDSEFLDVAVFIIASGTEPENYRNAVLNARAFHNELKGNRIFQTSEAYYIYLALFGLTNMTPRAGIAHLEHLHQRICSTLNLRSDSDLALWSAESMFYSSIDDVERVKEIRDMSKRYKLYRAEFVAFPTLGMLSRIPQTPELLIQQVQGVQNYLIKQKGFGQLSVPRRELYTLAIMIIASAYLDNLKQKMGLTPELKSLENIILSTYYTMVLNINNHERQVSVIFTTKMRD